MKLPENLSSESVMNRFFKFFTFIVTMHVMAAECHADSMTRDEFLEAVKGSFVTEMGTFGTTTGDERKFGEYICKNWPAVLADYNNLALLKTDQMHGLSYTTISLACEELPPSDYLNFLDKMLDVLEQRKSRNELTSTSDLLLNGRGRKKSFLAVNWEHPRVQAILQRAIHIFSDTDPDAASSFQREANGELADNYMANEPDDAPLPETLPGIKLKRPFSSLLKQIERLTGKKTPPDPRFPDDKKTRPARRGDSPIISDNAEPQASSGFPAPWSWMAFAAAISVIAMTLWKFRVHRVSRPP